MYQKIMLLSAGLLIGLQAFCVPKAMAVKLAPGMFTEGPKEAVYPVNEKTDFTITRINPGENTLYAVYNNYSGLGDEQPRIVNIQSGDHDDARISILYGSNPVGFESIYNFSPLMRNMAQFHTGVEERIVPRLDLKTLDLGHIAYSIQTKPSSDVWLVGRVDISKCLNALEYRDGMECRAEDDGSGIFQYQLYDGEERINMTYLEEGVSDVTDDRVDESTDDEGGEIVDEGMNEGASDSATESVDERVGDGIDADKNVGDGASDSMDESMSGEGGEVVDHISEGKDKTMDEPVAEGVSKTTSDITSETASDSISKTKTTSVTTGDTTSGTTSEVVDRTDVAALPIVAPVLPTAVDDAGLSSNNTKSTMREVGFYKSEATPVDGQVTISEKDDVVNMPELGMACHTDDDTKWFFGYILFVLVFLGWCASFIYYYKTRKELKKSRFINK